MTHTMGDDFKKYNQAISKRVAARKAALAKFAKMMGVSPAEAEKAMAEILNEK